MSPESTDSLILRYPVVRSGYVGESQTDFFVSTAYREGKDHIQVIDITRLH